MGYTLTGAALLGLAGLDVCFSFVPAATFRPEFASSLRFSQKSSTSNKGRGTNPGERRSRAAAAVGPVQATQKSKEEQESDVFDWLASNAGVDKIVSLGTVAGGGHRGLVMNSDVEEGQVVLEVPSDVCLWSTRDGVVSGLLGQTDMCWEAAGDLREAVSDDDYARGLTWDVRLAVALLEATSDPQIGGKFWDVYGRMLPQPHTIAVPFCLPERLLTQLHNDGMAKRAAKQVDRLRSIYPDLMRSLLSHPKTAIYAAGKTKEAGGGGEAVESDVSPMALVWAFAMVRSRAFTSNDDRFALVPFLDMANHGFSPSTNFTYEEPGVYRLRAMRDMRAGEEATISYGEDLNADQLMVQYGFPVPTELPLARPLGDTDAVQNRASAAAKAERDSGVGSVADEATPEEGAAAAEGEGEEWGEVARRSLMDEMFMLGQQRFAREAGSDSLKFETLVRRALPLIPPIATAIGKSRGGGGATEGAKAYLEELLAYRTANFPSTEEQDKELLRYCLGDGRGKVDQRLADVVRYRLARKEAHSLAVDILEEYLAPPPPPPPPAPPVVEDAAEDGREEAESSPVESDDAAQRTEA